MTWCCSTAFAHLVAQDTKMLHSQPLLYQEANVKYHQQQALILLLFADLHHSLALSIHLSRSVTRDDIMPCTSVALACSCLTITKLKSLRTAPTQVFFQVPKQTKIYLCYFHNGLLSRMRRWGGSDEGRKLRALRFLYVPRHRIAVEHAMLKAALTRLELQVIPSLSRGKTEVITRAVVVVLVTRKRPGKKRLRKNRPRRAKVRANAPQRFVIGSLRVLHSSITYLTRECRRFLWPLNNRYIQTCFVPYKIASQHWGPIAPQHKTLQNLVTTSLENTS